MPNHNEIRQGTIRFCNMMTSWNGNILRVTGPLWGESTGHRRIPLTKASGAELCCYLWSAPAETVEQTIETTVIWDAIALIMTSLQSIIGCSVLIFLCWSIRITGLFSLDTQSPANQILCHQYRLEIHNQMKDYPITSPQSVKTVRKRTRQQQRNKVTVESKVP